MGRNKENKAIEFEKVEGEGKREEKKRHAARNSKRVVSVSY